MTKRAQNAIPEWYAQKNPAIAALVAFAAQNPSLEPRNYFDPYDRKVGRLEDGLRAYREEQRNISKDWRRVKDALAEAMAEGVTDQHVIAEAPHAFSGRLEWAHDSKCPIPLCHGRGETTAHHTPCSCCHWDYCTGQYFPTEYRKAAATLLEYAVVRARQERPPTTAAVESIAGLKALNTKNGGCWFRPDTMRFFGTRIESGIIRQKYFITSEQPPHDVRKFSVRTFNSEGDVDTVGEFCAYSNKREAIAAIPKD